MCIRTSKTSETADITQTDRLKDKRRKSESETEREGVRGRDRDR